MKHYMRHENKVNEIKYYHIVCNELMQNVKFCSRTSFYITLEFRIGLSTSPSVIEINPQRAPSQYKDRLSQVWDSHTKDKTIARQGDPYTDKTYLYWDGSLWFSMIILGIAL